MHKSGCLAALTALLLSTSVEAADSFAVTIEVDASRGGAALTPIWRFFGADEPNYATMKDGRQLLGELGALKQGDIYFRAHNLLSSARPRSSGAAATRTPKTQPAIRCMTGASSTASSTPIYRTVCAHSCSWGSCPSL